MKQNCENVRYSDEREIHLTELIWKLLYAWRLILICTILMAILVSGFQYLSARKNAKAALDSQQNISLEEKRAALSDSEQAALTQAENVQRQLEEKKAYQRDSILMNMDAYTKNVVTLQYYVDTNYTVDLSSTVSLDYATSLIESYTTYVEDKGLLSKVCDTLDWSTEDIYIGELIDVGGRISNDGEQKNDVSESGDVFTLYITGENADSADELADAVAAAIGEYKSVLDMSIGTHDLTLVDRYDSVVTDETLATTQAALLTSISDLQTRLDNLTTSFTEEQQQILSGITEGDTSAAETIVKIEVSKKYIVFGAALGFFLSCMWVVVCYILSNKIKTADEFRDIYNLRLFGKIALDKMKKKRFLSVVDRGLDKLRNKTTWTTAKQDEFARRNLITVCKKEGVKKIVFVTSLHLEEPDKQRINSIVHGVNESGIQASLEEDMIYNAAAVEQLAEIGRVVLIEKIGITSYTAIEKELIFCDEFKADVLGCLVVE